MRVGDTFGRLTVVQLLPAPSLDRWHPRARVRCACGTEKLVRRSNLIHMLTRSCGCLQRELSTERHREHGHAAGRATTEYKAWADAKQRVTNQNNRCWARYGGRGITMAPEWLDDFSAFLAHVGLKPSPELSLDRIDNSGGYFPSNVRWATAKQQRANQRPRSEWTHPPLPQLAPVAA